jgi:hypothetical protein
MNHSNHQLKPSENITPSKQTIFATLSILLPIFLLFEALYSGLINP